MIVAFSCISLSTSAHSGIVVLVKDGCGQFWLAVGNWHDLDENFDAISSGASGIYMDANKDGYLNGCCNGSGKEFNAFTDAFSTSTNPSWSNVGSKEFNELRNYFKNNYGSSSNYTLQEVWRGSSCGNALESWLIMPISFSLKPYYKYLSRVSSTSVVEEPCSGTPNFYVTFNPGDLYLVSNSAYICSGDSVRLSVDDDFNNKWYYNDKQLSDTNDTIWVSKPGDYYVTSDTGCKTKLSNTLSIKDGAVTIDLGKDQDLCVGDKITLGVGSGFTGTTWSTGGSGNSIDVTKSGIYSVTTSSSTSGCEAQDTIKLSFHQPAFSWLKYRAFCTGAILELKSPDTLNSILWSTGERTKSIFISKPGDYWLQITDKFGCSYGDTTEVREHADPVVDFSIDSSKNCRAGNSFIFNDISTITLGKISNYFWNVDNIPISGSPTTIIRSFSKIGKHSVALKIVSDKGFESEYYQKQIEVHPMPSVQLYLKDTLQCFRGNRFDFGSVELIESGSLRRVWDFGDNLQDTSLITDHSYQLPGKYKVRLSVFSEYNCVDTARRYINVKPHPISKIAIQEMNECQAENFFEFTDVSTIAPGNVLSKNNWDFGNGEKVQNVGNHKISYATHGTYRVTLNVVSNHGCMDNDTLDIYVKPSPTAQITILKEEYCVNEQINFTGLGEVDTGSINKYTWDLDDSRYSVQKEFETSYDTSGSYTVMLEVRSDLGCFDSFYQKIIINPLPKADFILDANSKYCIEDNGINCIDQSSVLNGVIEAWFWDFGHDSSYLKEPDIVDYQTAGIKSIMLKVQSSKGCFDSISKQHSIYPQPLARFTVQPVCHHDSAEFNDFSTAEFQQTIDSFRWEFGDDRWSNEAQPKHLYNEPRTYYPRLIVSTNQGCVDTSDVANLSIKPSTKAVFSFNRIESYDKQTTYKFTNLSDPVDIVQWNFNDESLAFDFHPNPVTFLDSGTKQISLELTNEFGCINREVKLIKVYPDLTNLYIPNAFTPTTKDNLNNIFKPIGIGYPEVYELKVYNRWGDNLFTSNELSLGWNGKVKDKDCPSGIYLYTLSVKAFGHDHRKDLHGTIQLIK